MEGGGRFWRPSVRPLPAAMLVRGLAALLVLQLSYAGNILIVSTVASHSHSLWCNRLAEVLVHRGHQVTILDTDPPRKKLANLTTYQFEGAYDIVEDYNYDELSSKGSPRAASDFIYDISAISCKGLLFSPTFKRFLDEHSRKGIPFDLIIDDITNCECFLGLVPFLGNPKLIGVSAFGDEQATFTMSSHPNLILTPLFMSPYTQPMSYPEMFENFLYSLYNYYKYYRYVNELDGYSKEVFGSSTPHVHEIAATSALVLVNSHPILNGVKHYGPAIIPIPGFHIDEPKSLEVGIREFLDSAEHGAIYFSLGTNIQSELLSKERIRMFLNVFKNLKQRVLWKFEDKNNIEWPKNVMVSKWFRQSDILAHPNMKIFISHCGLLGTQEALYHGVPIIAMPFIIDQHFNSEKLVKKGVAVPLHYTELSESKIQAAIDTLLHDESYRNEMKKLSAVFKDRPTSPKDLAVYWIEYVLRHEDLSFLKPPEAYLSKLELFLLDIKTIICIVIGIVIAVFMKLNSSRHKKKKYKKH